MDLDLSLINNKDNANINLQKCNSNSTNKKTKINDNQFMTFQKQNSSNIKILDNDSINNNSVSKFRLVNDYCSSLKKELDLSLINNDNDINHDKMFDTQSK